MTGKRESMGKQRRGTEVRQALSRLVVSLLSLQQFPTTGFSKEVKGSARAHLGAWDGNLLSCLSVLLGGAQVPQRLLHFHSNLGHLGPGPSKINTRQLMYFNFQDTKINYCSLRLKHLNEAVMSA